MSQEAHDQAEASAQQQAAEQRQRELEHERQTVQAQVAALQTRLANITAEQHLAAGLETQRAEAARCNETQLARARKAD